jgi:hypothetical protein
MVQPLYYFPCVYAFADLLQESTISFDKEMLFKRSSYRNRMIIAAANGAIQLSIPVIGGRAIKSIYKEVEIDYRSHWQRDHFRTLCTAYGNSPFFMFYRDELEKLYQETPRLLYEWNLMCLAWVLKKMKIEKRIENEIVHENELQKTSFFELYTPQNSHTHSTSISSTYNQVFADKTGFLPNLSILDLLFNEGPHAKQVLLNINAKLPSNSSV